MNITDFLHVDDNLKDNKGLTDEKIVFIVKSKNNEPEMNPNKGPLEVILTKKS